MATPFVFQAATAFNASSLTGASLGVGNNNSLLLWFVPAASYDGTVALQFTVDGGTTWYPMPFYDITTAVGTALYSLASPGSSKAYLAPLLTNTTIRVLMVGGSVGSLTATGLLTSYLAP